MDNPTLSSLMTGLATVASPVDQTSQSRTTNFRYGRSERFVITRAGRGVARYNRVQRLNKQDQELLCALAVLFGGITSTSYTGEGVAH